MRVQFRALFECLFHVKYQLNLLRAITEQTAGWSNYLPNNPTKYQTTNQSTDLPAYQTTTYLTDQSPT
jgi:hypothetical protein